MLTGLLYSRAFCRPSRVTAGTMRPMEGANWTVGTCIFSHWLCGPLVCYWPLCGRHGCSWSVPQGWFLPPLSPPTPPRPTTPHPTRPTTPHPTSHPTHPIINNDGRKRQQKYLEIQPSETEKVSYNRKQ